MAEADADTERATVRTYVPAYQKEAWREHAEELDMSQSEFVRTMVQAGRRGFGEETNPEEPDSPDANPRGDDLESDVLDLVGERPRSWDELREAIVGDLEDQLEETLQELQRTNRIQHSGSEGGYVTADE